MRDGSFSLLPAGDGGKTHPRRAAGTPTRWSSSWARTCCGSDRCSPRPSRSPRSRSAAGTSRRSADRQLGPADPQRRAADDHPGAAGQDLRRPGLRLHRRALSHPGRGGHRGRLAGGGDRPVRSPSSTGSRGETRNCGRVGITIENAGEPFDGKYTSRPPGTVTTRHGATPRPSR